MSGVSVRLGSGVRDARLAALAEGAISIAPVAPTPAHVWVPGHWAWHRHHYVWVPGRWEVPASPGYVWVPGGWMPRNNGYVWVEGHWRAR